MKTKFFGFLLALLTLGGFVAFAQYSHFFSQKIADGHEAVHFWDDAGNFIYTGALLSSATGSENFFTGAIGVNAVKSIHSDTGSEPRYYIEYPDFSEMQNLPILTKIRDKIITLGEKDKAVSTSTGGIMTGYDSYFSLSNGNNVGSIIYDIHKHSSGALLEESVKQVFLITAPAETYSPKDFVDISATGSIHEFIGKISEIFSKKFPNKSLYPADILEQNLIGYLDDPQFSFSGSDVHFYINSGIFSQNVDKSMELVVPYADVQKIILSTPKPKVLPTEKKAEKNGMPKSSDGKKYVALTFDDGPHKVNTPALLDILKTKKVHATFFVLGENVAGREEILKREVVEGHEVGMHSWSHPSFTKLSKQAMRTEMQKTEEAIRNATGITPKIFRPPYGAYNPTVIKTTNIPIIMWSVDSLDWKNRNVQKNLKTALSEVYDGSIILFHDIHKESVDTIPALIDALRKQ